MFWANALSLDMLAQKIDDMLNAKQMLSVLILSLWKNDFFFLVIVTRPFEKAAYIPLS